MGNKERNNFVKQSITKTTICLLSEKELSSISISEICSAANVSRNSFYRNYDSVQDILKGHVRNLLTDWDTTYKASGKNTNYELYGSLFGHLKENSDFYLLLEQRGLFDLVLDVLLELFGPKPELPNMWAYTISFIQYGTYGWIKEWISRGMQESEDEMAKLLSEHGMK